MSDTANFLKYMLLGIAAVALYTQDVSLLLNKISIFVFWICVLNLTILLVYDKIISKKTYYPTSKIPIRGKPFIDKSLKTKLIYKEPKEEKESRYISQEKYFGTLDQNALKEKSVAIVGLGGIGTICAELLARAGIGKLILIDSEIVVPRDIKDGTIYVQKDIGREKTLTTMEYISSINSEVNIEQHNILLQEHNCVILDSDVVLDCTKKNGFVADFCTSRDLPFVICRQWNDKGIISFQEKVKAGSRKAIPMPGQFFGASIQAMVALKVLLKKRQARMKIGYSMKDLSIKKTTARKTMIESH